MTRRVQDVCEVVGSVAGTVVSDDPFDPVDAVGGEPHAGAMHESDCSDCLFVVEGFRIGQSRVAVDG